MIIQYEAKRTPKRDEERKEVCRQSATSFCASHPPPKAVPCCFNQCLFPYTQHTHNAKTCLSGMSFPKEVKRKKGSKNGGKNSQTPKLFLNNRRNTHTVYSQETLKEKEQVNLYLVNHLVKKVPPPSPQLEASSLFHRLYPSNSCTRGKRLPGNSSSHLFLSFRTQTQTDRY